MNAICLFVAAALRASLPASEFTLAFDHSVEKTRWEERYRVDGKNLLLIEARIQGSGAGMDPPPNAHLRHGWWTWRPSVGPLPELRLTLSPFARDYDLCWRARCQTLGSLVVPNRLRDAAHSRTAPDEIAVVAIRPCTGKDR
ncbi:MAG: DUF1850 domain-containing protein [Pseudomonadota bacterium]|nr:DUF1850 domain-containing protein [Pseudomonadota bacterium]